MPSVAVYVLRGNARSRKIGDALARGIGAAGDVARVRLDAAYTRPDTEVAAFYGYQMNQPRIMQEYVDAGRTVVFIDLGYWGRRDGGRYTGFHKVALNARHPTAHFQRRKHDDSRLRRFGLEPRPWQKAGRHILVAGMSGKAAAAIGLQPEEWERSAIDEIRRHTDRPIVYRPKPSWDDAAPIEGTDYSSERESLQGALGGCHAVVTHHSNVAVEGLVAGVPAFCWDGVATPMALQDLGRIEDPIYPKGRRQWMSDIAWFQWSLAEIGSGAMWQFLKGEGLV